ncbi:MAG: hypothetical protein OXD54_19140 [Candidatus Poribacteria bacterium]|nr:hypothetical protein [Candidatus Poribacteria bacterium]
MHWQKLKELIQTLDKQEKGKKKGEAFEKLVARLLELLHEIPFVSAKSGTQPRGDSRSVDGTVAIQAKNYSHKSNLDTVKVIGDLQIILNNSQDLEVYILVVSRDVSEQLLTELQKVEKNNGVDIVTLELNDKLSDLGALCVKFWEEINHFFDLSNSDQEFLAWIEKISDDSETQEKYENLKLKLEQGIQSQYHVKEYTKKYLSDRFSRDEGFNHINLSQAIDRQEIVSKIGDWWESDDVPICYLQGEEGTGKTWLAAKWMNSIHESENIVTFWLDSKDWNGCMFISDLLKNCLSSIYESHKQEKISKLQNKIAKIWRKTLIVLDGVNERGAIEALQAILNEFFQPESEWQEKIRFLFTTRTLDDYPLYESYLWKKCHKISVSPFNDSELYEVLTREGMQPHDLPDSLKEIAKFPRYFNRCIELKDKLGSFDVVTKEMILLADLSYKIENSDPQIREKLGLSRVEDIKDVLVHLAQQMEWQNINDTPIVTAELLKECFSDYSKVRIDLEEQRITTNTSKFQAELSADHVILCWALYLTKLFDYIEFTEVIDFAKDFQNALEPIPSEDLRTEALFAALQITAISPDSDISHDQLSQKRAALMFAWSNSHNAQITKERISFWAEKDTNAYAQLVEAKFLYQISPNEEDALIEPLAKVWRNKKGQINHLESYLTKWLLPQYTDEHIIGDDIDPEDLPYPTLHYTNTRLATAALSILSQRPERQFLSALAHCYTIHEMRPRLNENIGRLVRWVYTEAILDDLISLEEKTQSDESLLAGMCGLANELKQVKLPEPLQRPSSEENKKQREFAEQWNRNIKPYIDRIRAQEKLLKDDSPAANVNGNYLGLDFLAVRSDLPVLRDDDLVKIEELLQYISKNAELGTGVGATLEDSCIQNLLPWVSKNDPEGYAELACSIKLNTLNQRWAQFKLLSIQGLIFKPEDRKKITLTILGMKELLAQGDDVYSDVTWLTYLLTETLLFCASDEILVDWFIFLASHEPLRSSICYESLPYIFEYLLPASIVELAQKKLEEHRESSHEDQNTSDPTSEEFSEEKYWCVLFASESKVEDRTVKYALEDLKMRKPDSIGTFPMLGLALSRPKLFLDEILIDENIQKHLFSKNGRRWIIGSYDGKDVPSYELLRSFLPTEIIGSFLCTPDRKDDLSQWGKDLMEWVFSILNRNEGNSNPVQEELFEINREVYQVWAEQNHVDFLYLSTKYLTSLSESPAYQQSLSRFTDVIYCLLLRFQPETALKFYRQWSAEIVRTIYTNQYGVETILAQFWKVAQCNTPQHVQHRRTLLEECKNDQEILFMTIAALSGGGKEELWNLVTQEYLNSQYAKQRNLAVSILPWFGSDEVIELLNQLKSDDPSLWVRGHAAWAYEVAQQERSCQEVYREALQSRNLFRISAVFELIQPALSPTARWWHRQIEKELGLISESQYIDPKFIALVDRFWIRWGNSSKTRQNIEIFGRKLSEYCRGEKLGSGSPPRLAPWWKPE